MTDAFSTRRAKQGPVTAVVAQRMKELRAERGWKVTELAKRCADAGMPQLSRDLLANIENDRRDRVSVDELFVLAHVFGVRPATLLLPAEAEDSEPYPVTDEVAFELGFLRREWFGLPTKSNGRIEAHSPYEAVEALQRLGQIKKRGK